MYPRGPLPSASLRVGRDPSPLTSPARLPRADISAGPAEQRAPVTGTPDAPPSGPQKLRTRSPRIPDRSRGARAGQVTTSVPLLPPAASGRAGPFLPPCRAPREEPPHLCSGGALRSRPIFQGAGTPAAATPAHSGPCVRASRGRLATPPCPAASRRSRRKEAGGAWRERLGARTESRRWKRDGRVRRSVASASQC